MEVPADAKLGPMLLQQPEQSFGVEGLLGLVGVTE